MKTLINWSAKRAGGRITIHGYDRRTHEPVKLVGVDTITARAPKFGRPLAPVATHKTGAQYALA